MPHNEGNAINMELKKKKCQIPKGNFDPKYGGMENYSDVFHPKGLVKVYASLQALVKYRTFEKQF